jgi:endonuclease/exonuclease/phosphatase family metal-dependent hydrolase
MPGGAEFVRQYDHVVLMGDMNSPTDSEEMRQLMTRTGLTSSRFAKPSYPSWNPTRRIDHILVSPSITIEETRVLDFTFSDHLPVAMMVSLPERLKLGDGEHLTCRKAA